MKFAFLIAFGLPFAAVPTTAAVGAAAFQAEDDQKADPNAVRCERRASTGSRVRRVRICLTNAQWEQLANESRRDATTLQDAGTIDPAGEGG